MVFTLRKNSLKAFPKSNITFNLLPHLELDKKQKCIIDKDKNIRYIADILDIGNNRHDIDNRQSFEGKLAKKSIILVIYRY